MTHHLIPLERTALIGSFTAEAVPVVSIRSGDTLRFQTLDAGWGTGNSNKDRFKPYARRENLDSGHALIGPIYVEGAKQGMILALTFNEIIPGPYGFTAAGHYPNWQNQKLRLTEYEELVLDWKLNDIRREATCQIRDQLYTLVPRPFMGIVGMPPEPTGVHSTWPPRFCGGNIDCKELVAGSTLYLPIPVDGAYLAIGDGHALQGDGEVSCQAIECPMDLVDVTVHLIDEKALANPRANTPEGWITFGFDQNLDEATVQALDGMLDLMGELFGLNRVEAIALGSSVVDLRITQIANGTKGVHACLPHRVFKSEPVPI